jgi:hypothetical protein
MLLSMTEAPIFAWFCVAFVCVFVILTVVGNIRLRKTYERLTSERQGESFGTFLAACSANVDAAVAQFVYREVIAELRPRTTSALRPSDRLVEELKFDAEDADYFIIDLFSKARRKIPKEVSKPVCTVGDLVSILQASPPR